MEVSEGLDLPAVEAARFVNQFWVVLPLPEPSLQQLGLSLSPGATHFEQCQERKPDAKALGLFLVAVGARAGGSDWYGPGAG